MKNNIYYFDYDIQFKVSVKATDVDKETARQQCARKLLDYLKQLNIITDSIERETFKVIDIETEKEYNV